MSTCIVVLGCHRSGTSAVAGALFQLGVFMGTRRIGQTKYNPLGHWEDKDFVDLNKRIVGDWRHPFVDFEPVRAAYRELVRGRESKFQVWGFKDPRMCYVFPYFAQVVKAKLKVINVTRNTRSIVRSLVNRKGKGLNVSGKQATRIVRCYLSAKDMALRTFGGPILVVPYEGLVKKPEEQMRIIAKFSGRPFVQEAAGFIVPKFKHF